ncbi:hypothetical protein BVRB_5g111980 [Beta vulgaris subsp. vulgaris]|nr:hypothetical protein BVRB_5g111980 [Beta vulgaris subsp. vulgaris]
MACASVAAVAPLVVGNIMKMAATTTQAYLESKPVQESKALLTELCRQFYHLGWVGLGAQVAASLSKFTMIASLKPSNSLLCPLLIMIKASETLIPVTLELGGKDAFIVCEDVDVEHVAQLNILFYVHRDIYNAFVAQVVKIVKSVTAGPPLAGKYDMGAICMQDHAEKLQSLVTDALDKGAEIAGRGRLGNLGTDVVDQFFPPTFIVNVNHSMQIMQEEVIRAYIMPRSGSDDI